jgi:geranylgeranyl diphosphate synthase type I
MAGFSPSLDELKTLVDAELQSVLSSTRKRLPRSGDMVDEIARLLSAGGKRLRPAFCYWGYRASGAGHKAETVRAAASLELLHTFAMVHDDIMDSSQQRRGEPTVHARRGVGSGLLVGDLALVLADAAFMESGFAPSTLMRAFRSYSRMRQEVIVGQHMELELSAAGVVNEEDARVVARMKSGGYSVREPLLIGAALANSGEEASTLLASFGECVGEAFQLRDDLLGTFGRPEETGKPVDSDIREGKRHLLFARTVASLRGEEREFFATYWGGGDSLSSDDVERLRRAIESSGARRSTEKLCEELRKSALQSLEGLADGEARAALEALADVATIRSS